MCAMSGLEEDPALALTDLLDQRQLIVLSNREPYTHSGDAKDHHTSFNAGGLVAALEPAMRRAHGTWVAWGNGSADFDVTDANDTVQIGSPEDGFTLRRVRIPPPLLRGYYDNLSNRVLWPLAHLLLGRVRFRQTDWQQYVAVNQLFARAASEMARSVNPMIWVHDYHLGICPESLRRRLPQAEIRLFWHIPFPSADVWRAFPQAAEYLRGMLGADEIAFHVAEYVHSFLDAVENVLHLPVDRELNEVLLGTRRVRVRAIPIGIDVATWHKRLADPRTSAAMASWQERLRLPDRKLLLGVDRLDYTKGLLPKLTAYTMLLEQHPEWRERVVLVQKVATTRQTVEDYQILAASVRKMVDDINQRFGTPDWQPVLYLPERIDRFSQTALYRLADVMVVSPLRDGMNLVAMEYIATQHQHNGALVLSELAGVAETLRDNVVLVNPYDLDGFGQALLQALELDPALRARQMAAMAKHIEALDVRHWLERCLAPAAR